MIYVCCITHRRRSQWGKLSRHRPARLSRQGMRLLVAETTNSNAYYINTGSFRCRNKLVGPDILIIIIKHVRSLHTVCIQLYLLLCLVTPCYPAFVWQLYIRLVIPTAHIMYCPVSACIHTNV